MINNLPQKKASKKWSFIFFVTIFLIPAIIFSAT